MIKLCPARAIYDPDSSQPTQTYTKAGKRRTYFPGRHPPAAGHELPPDILCNGRRAVKARQQAGLELALRTLNLAHCWRDAHLGPLMESKVQQIVEIDKVSETR